MAVEDDQRVVSGVGRTRTADADRASVDADAGNADQAGREVVGRDAGDLLGRNRSDRSGDVLAFHGGVTRDDDILETDHVFAQRDVDGRARADFLFLREHSEEAEFQLVRGLYAFNRIGARGIGDDALRSSYDCHGHSRDGVAGGVAHRARYGLVLRGGGDGCLSKRVGEIRIFCGGRYRQQRCRQQDRRTFPEGSARYVPQGARGFLVQTVHV